MCIQLIRQTVQRNAKAANAFAIFVHVYTFSSKYLFHKDALISSIICYEYV